MIAAMALIIPTQVPIFSAVLKPPPPVSLVLPTLPVADAVGFPAEVPTVDVVSLADQLPLPSLSVAPSTISPPEM